MHFIQTLNKWLDQMFLPDLFVFNMNDSVVYVLQNILFKLTCLFSDSLFFIPSSLFPTNINFHIWSTICSHLYHPDRYKAIVVSAVTKSVLRHIMKTFIVLAASAIALASGLCLEDDEVVAMCTVGTPIGEEQFLSMIRKIA